MTFKVNRYGCGYKISIGIGKTFYAKNLDEISAALNHYYCGSQHNKDECPLCKED
jgi:hypothetical protein